MKIWTLSARIVFSIAAYLLSYILLCYSSIYQNFVSLFQSPTRTFLIFNITVLVIIGFNYKRFTNVVIVTCLLFAAPSVMAHSKFLKKLLLGSEYTQYPQYFSAHLTALLFFAAVVLLMAARRLERLDKQYDEMISGGALEADVNLIILNNIKMYSVFLVVVLLIGLILIALGFVVPQIKASWLTIIIMVITGIALVIGCVLYLHRRWTKK